MLRAVIQLLARMALNGYHNRRITFHDGQRTRLIARCVVARYIIAVLVGKRCRTAERARVSFFASVRARSLVANATIALARKNARIRIIGCFFSSNVRHRLLTAVVLHLIGFARKRNRARLNGQLLFAFQVTRIYAFHRYANFDGDALGHVRGRNLVDVIGPVHAVTRVLDFRLVAVFVHSGCRCGSVRLAVVDVFNILRGQRYILCNSACRDFQRAGHLRDVVVFRNVLRTAAYRHVVKHAGITRVRIHLCAHKLVFSLHAFAVNKAALVACVRFLPTVASFLIFGSRIRLLSIVAFTRNGKWTLVNRDGFFSSCFAGIVTCRVGRTYLNRCGARVNTRDGVGGVQPFVIALNTILDFELVSAVVCIGCRCRICMQLFAVVHTRGGAPR